jgi:hypothetical protein
MESLPAFMRETYVIKPDNRIPVKDIYEDFRIWVIAKFGTSIWNNITQRQVYAALKEFPDYGYIRYKEGFCLKGITKIIKDEKLDIMEDIIPVNLPNEVKTITLKIIPETNIIIPSDTKVVVPETRMLQIVRPDTKIIIPEAVKRDIKVVIPEIRTAPKVPQMKLPKIGHLI